jgi:selenocysteine-specific translation elongation factor
MVTVCVLGSKEYAKNIGKKGTSSDITLYNLKSGDNIVTAVEPSSYPDKLSSLFYAVNMSDFVVFVVNGLDSDFAETVVMLDSLDKREGVFITEEQERVANFVRGTAAENFSFIENDPIALREMLLKIQMNQRTTDRVVRDCVVIDHFFKVKGVGTVILGIVSNGCVNKHEKLNLFPSGKAVQIRSIQKQDVDCEKGCAGDRVGLALKGVEPEEIERGYILSSGEIRCLSEIDAKLEINRFYKREIKGIMHIGCGLQFLPARVKDFDGSTISLELEKEKPIALYDRMILCDLSATKPRIVGKLTYE